RLRLLPVISLTMPASSRAWNTFYTCFFDPSMIRSMNSLLVYLPCNFTFELLKGWQDLRNCLFDRRKVFLRDLPNPPQIYACVIVNQNIPESCHQPPGNLRMLGAKLLGNSLGCLTDNLKVPDDRILHHGVMQKGFSVLTDVLFDPVSTL